MNDEKLDKLYDKVSEMSERLSERLARVETMIHERTDDTKETRDTLERHERRIAELEKHKSSVIGAKDIATWIVMAGIALWGAVK